jgi:hypothetical protein
VSTQVSDQFDIGHAHAVLELTLEGTTSNASVEAFIGSHFGSVAGNWPELQRRRAVQREPHVPRTQRRELGQALRTTLDLYCTGSMRGSSLATKRLDEMRENSPQGARRRLRGGRRPAARLGTTGRPGRQPRLRAPSRNKPPRQRSCAAAIWRVDRPPAAFNIDLRRIA